MGRFNFLGCEFSFLDCIAEGKCAGVKFEKVGDIVSFKFGDEVYLQNGLLIHFTSNSVKLLAEKIICLCGGGNVS